LLAVQLDRDGNQNTKTPQNAMKKSYAPNGLNSSNSTNGVAVLYTCYAVAFAHRK
jgi:hypothetical protein